MSLSDELKRAAEKMKKAQLEDRLAPKRRVASAPRGSSAGSAAGSSRNAPWSKQDEVIALYLCLAGSGKFLKENYAKKRKVSLASMQRKIDSFEELRKGKAVPAIADQTKEIFDRYSKLEIDELQKIVISILRGECHELP
jgi:hypothetical protein